MVPECFNTFEINNTSNGEKDFRQTHIICPFTRNMPWYWTAIQTFPWVFKIHETVVSAYGHKIPYVSLQNVRIYIFAKTPGTGHQKRVQFCNWFSIAVFVGEVNHVLTYFTYKELL